MPEMNYLNEHEKLVSKEWLFGDVEIREKSTGKTGIANSYHDDVAVFYGADDGSDDKVVSIDEFNEKFEVIN